MKGAFEFYKMSGGGNDFILIDNRQGNIDADALRPLIARICRRRFAVGADGLIIIEPSANAHFRWRFFNADGSEARMCGNGGRCAARLAHLLGIAPAELSFETGAGIVAAKVEGRMVRLTLPPPADIRLGVTVEVAGTEFSIDFIDTGVPHAVIVVPELSQIDVVGLGRRIRHHEAFQPAGTNVDFIRVEEGVVHIRTYERGVEDETMACGTGAVAAAIIAGIRGLTTPPTRVMPKSGEPLTISYKMQGKVTQVTLAGEVRLIYRGWLREEAYE